MGRCVKECSNTALAVERSPKMNWEMRNEDPSVATFAIRVYLRTNCK